MTFKDLKTGQTDFYWDEFYRKLGIEVPEGKLVCKPNGLAASEHLRKVGVLEVNRPD